MNYPEDNQTGVAVNSALTHVFDVDLDPDSIFSGSVVLYETSTEQVVDGTYSYDVASRTISFMPDTTLNPFSSYVWYFTGEDTTDASPLELVNGNPMPETVSVGFQTGDTVIVTTKKGDTIASYYEDLDIIDDGQSEDQRGADQFRVVSTTPELHESFVDVLTDTVTITFSSPVKAGQDFNSLIKLSYEPLLRETYYFKNGKFNPATVKRIPGCPEAIFGTEEFQMPEGVWDLSTDGLTLTWTKEEAWNANAFVKVQVSKLLLNDSDISLNANQDEEFYFITDIFPLFSNLEAVLLPLSSVPGLVSEEVVLKYILKHSLDAWHLSNKKVDLARPLRAAVKYVECATLVSLIDMKTILNEINRGKKIQLADLQVQYGFPRNPESALSQIRQDSATCMYEVKKELVIYADNYEFQIGERGKNTTLTFDVYRNRQKSPGDRGYL